MDTRDICLGEDNFIENMKTLIEPYISDYFSEGDFDGYDGSKLHYQKYIHPDAKVNIIISHGYSEFADKYTEMVYMFLRQGYSVYIPEHRGHGYSVRQVEDMDMVHVRDFEEYVDDFVCFMENVVGDSRENVLLAHSMGGAIGIGVLEKRPDLFGKAILSSPMCEMRTGKLTHNMAALIARFQCLIGNGKKYALNQKGFTATPYFVGSSCLSENRYMYTFEKREKNNYYRTHGSDYDWISAALSFTRKINKKKNIKKITAQILLFQAGQDHMVDNQKQNRFVENAMNARMIVAPASRHELFNATQEIRELFYREVVNFIKD